MAIVAGTLTVWAGSHFFGVGEIVDIVLLGVGVAALGFAVFEGAGELYEFGNSALGASYVTVSAMAAEGQAIGTITLGGALLHVSISQGPLPDVP